MEPFKRWLQLFAHLYRKTFRGGIHESMETDYGHLIRYTSGYTEMRDKDGRVHDVDYDVYFRNHSWTFLETQGGGKIVIGGMARDAATKYCAEHLGTLISIDDTNKFIFYKVVK